MADPFSAPACYGSFASFLHENPSRIYRYWIYRHGYTPYEQKQCFTDESLFEENHARFGVLREVIPLGGGDVLLGFAEFAEDTSEIVSGARAISYYRASDIRIVYMPCDADDRDPDGLLTNTVAAVNDQGDGTFFRVQRDGKWQVVCFSDLTDEERQQALRDWDNDALLRMCCLLADTIKYKCTRRCGDEAI